MNLSKNGKLLCDLRKAKGLTQKQVADKLGVVPKTVSKWETGHGFPDVSTISALADILGVSEKTILSGDLEQNLESANNMKRTKFYVCPHCGSFLQGTGNGQVVCCGKQLEALTAVSADDEHTINISEIEDDFYIEFNHAKKTNKDLHLICALPHPNFESRRSVTEKMSFNRIIKKADLVKEINDHYFTGCYQVRNEWMVDKSNLVIAVFNGQKSGTKNTVDYAKRKGVKILNVLDSI